MSLPVEQSSSIRVDRRIEEPLRHLARSTNVGSGSVLFQSRERADIQSVFATSLPGQCIITSTALHAFRRRQQKKQSRSKDARIGKRTLPADRHPVSIAQICSCFSSSWLGRPCLGGLHQSPCSNDHRLWTRNHLPQVRRPAEHEVLRRSSRAN